MDRLYPRPHRSLKVAIERCPTDTEKCGCQRAMLAAALERLRDKSLLLARESVVQIHVVVTNTVSDDKSISVLAGRCR